MSNVMGGENERILSKYCFRVMEIRLRRPKESKWPALVKLFWIKARFLPK